MVNYRYLFQQSCFVFRLRISRKIRNYITKSEYILRGMIVGKGSLIPTIFVTWPHQVVIGKNCILEHGIYLKYDGIWNIGPSINIGNHVFIGNGSELNIKEKITIGDNTLIASGCRFIDHDHGLELNELMRTQLCPAKEIVIGSDVWLGCNVVVLKGVVIGNGAVVAAGAVVTKSIPPYEIWGGIPAKKIGERK